MQETHVPCTERKCGLQVDPFGFPMDLVGELNAVACIPCRQANGLDKAGTFRFTLHLNCHAGWTTLDHGDLRRSSHVSFRCPLLIIEVHIPRRPMLRIVSGDSQTNRRGQQFAINLLVEDAGDVSVLIDRYAVACILQGRVGGLQLRSRCLEPRLAVHQIRRSRPTARGRGKEPLPFRCSRRRLARELLYLRVRLLERSWEFRWETECALLRRLRARHSTGCKRSFASGSSDR